MKRIMVLATALALLPAYALANMPRPAPRAYPPHSELLIPLSSAPDRLCAVPAPVGC